MKGENVTSAPLFSEGAASSDFGWYIVVTEGAASITAGELGRRSFFGSFLRWGAVFGFLVRLVSLVRLLIVTKGLPAFCLFGSFPVISGIVGDIPTRTFELNSRGRDQLLQAPSTLLTFRGRFVAHLLQDFETTLTLLTLKFIYRHSLFNPGTD